MTQYMLTTTDNPFSPFKQFDEWLAYDSEVGYDTPSFLARIVQSSDDMSESDQELAIQNAISEIVEENTLGVYIKVDASGARSM